MRHTEPQPMPPPGYAVAALFLLLCAPVAAPALPGPFADVTAAAGLSYQHVDASPDFDDQRHVAGGAGCGDYDGDGWLDLYVVRGDAGPGLLFRNRGDGTFEEVGAAAGVAVDGIRSGPTFADADGDGRLDLLVLGVEGTPARLFRNRGDGTFADVTAASGLDAMTRPSFSAAFGDPDRDGDLDLLVSHWTSPVAPGEPLERYWRNDGGRFVEASADAGFRHTPSPLAPALASLDLAFTPNFADLDADGWPDVVIAADYGTSRVYRNDGTGRFADVTAAVISDENGMGAAIGDYDNDGDLDWFVSSIWDPAGNTDEAWFASGNRLYRNRGDGAFDDVTEAAGVRQGYWGWGSTFADLDNDGDLDLFHVNGWHSSDDSAVFHADPSRLFVSNGDGTFSERSADVGLVDTGLGRGVVAFDYDRDGDVDLFVADNDGPGRLFRNDGPRGAHFLTVKLRGPGSNSQAIGARVTVEAGGVTQLRELRAGSNYASQDPAEAHFGLGEASVVDRLVVRWPDGGTTERANVLADAVVTVEHGAAPPPPPPVPPPAPPAPPAPPVGCTPATCVTGGASRDDCLLLARVGAPRLRPCVEGDAACDLDPDATNGACRVRLGLCSGGADPRAPRCRPRAASAVRLLRPASGSTLQDGATLAGLAGQLAAATGDGERCTGDAGVRVPLRRRRNGAAGAGKLVVELEARAADGGRDRDRLVLVCRPARR